MSEDNTELPTRPGSIRDSGTGVRLGCGTVVGLALGVPWAIGSLIAHNSGSLAAVELIASVTVCAFLSCRYGDRFYEVLAKWLPWLP